MELADVPFVGLRTVFEREFGRAAGSFRRLVQDCREHVRRSAGENVRLEVEQSRCEIDVNGTRLALAPREQILLLFLSSRCKQGGEPILSYTDALDPLNQFQKDLRESAPADALGDWRHGAAFRNPFQDEMEIRRALSSLRQKLRRAGGTRISWKMPAGEGPFLPRGPTVDDFHKMNGLVSQ